MSEICQKVHQVFNSLKMHSFPFDPKEIPQNGIYILFERGEQAHGTNRIVRVGTHTGQNQLRARLRQHFLNENKDLSIFRKNIGRALLNKDHDPFLAQWDIVLIAREARLKYAGKIDLDKLRQVERSITDYMQNHFNFVVFEVRTREERLKWESRIISTISWCEECGPSPQWLGLYSTKEKIRTGGLWLVNELRKQPLSELELDELCRGWPG